MEWLASDWNKRTEVCSKTSLFALTCLTFIALAIGRLILVEKASKKANAPLWGISGIMIIH